MQIHIYIHSEKFGKRNNVCSHTLNTPLCIPAILIAANPGMFVLQSSVVLISKIIVLEDFAPPSGPRFKSGHETYRKDFLTA